MAHRGYSRSECTMVAVATTGLLKPSTDVNFPLVQLPSSKGQLTLPCIGGVHELAVCSAAYSSHCRRHRPGGRRHADDPVTGSSFNSIAPVGSPSHTAFLGTKTSRPGRPRNVVVATRLSIDPIEREPAIFIRGLKPAGTATLCSDTEGGAI